MLTNRRLRAMTPNNTLQGTRFGGRHGFRHRVVRALERKR